MFRTALILAAACLGASACTMTPTVTKQQMTLGEANIEGMECRREAATGSAVPKTMCASPESWNRYDRKMQAASDAVLDRQRQATNVGPFNRQ
ncbi:MAG TPA: hypothetical protein VGO52_27575 [Hyphomonadaceae bacterium]|nr:hypothetical protein [Hyphomonadaceae bacterium]